MKKHRIINILINKQTILDILESDRSERQWLVTASEINSDELWAHHLERLTSFKMNTTHIFKS